MRKKASSGQRGQEGRDEKKCKGHPALAVRARIAQIQKMRSCDTGHIARSVRAGTAQIAPLRTSNFNEISTIFFVIFTAFQANRQTFVIFASICAETWPTFCGNCTDYPEKSVKTFNAENLKKIANTLGKS